MSEEPKKTENTEKTIGFNRTNPKKKGMSRKQKRVMLIGLIGAVVAFSLFLASMALRDEIVFFYDPSEVIEQQKVTPGQKFRLGGLVKTGSIEKNGTKVAFIVSDGANEITVNYEGLLPDLFREEQGVIAEGQLNADLSFTASTILAKHDENYIPKELEGVMKDKGVWKGEEQQ